MRRQRQEECIASGIRSWGMPGGSLQLLRETLAEPAPLLFVPVETSVAPYATLDDLKVKHPFKAAPSLPNIPIVHHQLVAPPGLVLDMIKSFPHGTSCGQDGLRAQHLMDCLSGAAVAISDELIASITQVVNLFLDEKCPKTLGEYIASAPLTPLVKPRGSIRPIVFGVGVSGGGEAILHAMNRLVEDHSDDIGLSMLLVDFKNAFNLVDREVMLQEVRTRCPAISRWVEFCYSNPARLSFHAWYLNDGTIIGDTLVVGKVLELIMEDGPRRGLHLNVDKTEVFWPKEDPRSRLVGVFPPTIARPLHGVKLLGSPVSVDFDFGCELVWKRVAKSIELMDVVVKLNDPQCELLLLRACAEHIVTASGAGFGDWQWRLATLPFSYEGLGVYFAGDVLGYAFLASRLQSSSLQTKVVPISGLGQTMNGRTYRCVLCYRLGVPLFSVPKSCLACSRVFMGDIYEDHAVSCAGIVGIKHRHNVVRDTLVDICYRSGISSGKEVDIGVWGGRDKSLRPADVLLYSWDCGRDVCVDLTRSSPLTQTGMVDFVPSRAVVVDDAQRKCGKYMAKCAAIGYGFLPFSFSSFGELEADAVSLLQRIRKFSMT
ncbi:hypothetical protein Tco_1196235 [Tanacetum coccineum]